MAEKKALDDNEVLLWGENPINKKLLKEYDFGNKNPQSVKRKKEEKEVKKEKKVRTFNLEEEYTPEDLDFLNAEYERIEKEISEKGWDDELVDLQDKLYELIEDLESKKGSGIKHHKVDNISLGLGFKKGSPEAKAHAEKMRLKLMEKKGNVKKEEVKNVKSTKSRVEKGSEEAKELGRKLAEARKKKLEEKKLTEKPKEEIKQEERRTLKGKPWFYIGDIPKGYREATEDEAIQAKKVSYYGKYVVDDTKWKLFNEYNILLSEDMIERDKMLYMSALKKRIMNSLKEIEILKSKIDNPKYKDKINFYENKLEEEKENRKYLQAGWNWYYKLYCEKKGIKYVKQKFELPKQEPLKVNRSNVIEIKEEIKIDPRTNKPVEKETYNKSSIKFYKNDEYIDLDKKYFDEDEKILPKYSKKLFEKNIILDKQYYKPEDYYNYVFKRL